jgi:hypothetical protein
MGDLLGRLRSSQPLDPNPEPGGLSDASLVEVLEALADSSLGQSTNGLLAELEARGIPQDQVLAVMFALLTSPH